MRSLARLAYLAPHQMQLGKPRKRKRAAWRQPGRLPRGREGAFQIDRELARIAGGQPWHRGVRYGSDRLAGEPQRGGSVPTSKGDDREQGITQSRCRRSIGNLSKQGPGFQRPASRKQARRSADLGILRLLVAREHVGIEQGPGQFADDDVA